MTSTDPIADGLRKLGFFDEQQRPTRDAARAEAEHHAARLGRRIIDTSTKPGWGIMYHTVCASCGDEYKPTNLSTLRESKETRECAGACRMARVAPMAVVAGVVITDSTSKRFSVACIQCEAPIGQRTYQNIMKAKQWMTRSCDCKPADGGPVGTGPRRVPIEESKAQHGTLSRYTHATHPCRCDECVAAHRAYYQQRNTGGPTGRPRQETCGRGHPFDDEHTYTDPQGGRHCRTCSREAEQRRNKRKQALTLTS